jgi:hypothetical protein
MINIITLEDFLTEKKVVFTEDQINECLKYLNSDDEQLLEAWYNTILDFAALIPGVGSIAEGVNLVSYARQGEYLLAGLCAIGLIPFFGQYIGAGGTLLVKALRGGGMLGKGLLKPLVNGIARFFPKISAFFKSSKFTSKFKGIAPYTDKMLGSLRTFVKTGGKQLKSLSGDKRRLRGFKKEVRNVKQGLKLGSWALGLGGAEAASNYGNMPSGPGSSQYAQIPVPQDAYMSYQGVPLKNIRPYTDMEISQAELSDDWSRYI